MVYLKAIGRESAAWCCLNARTAGLIWDRVEAVVYGQTARYGAITVGIYRWST